MFFLGGFFFLGEFGDFVLDFFLVFHGAFDEGGGGWGVCVGVCVCVGGRTGAGGGGGAFDFRGEGALAGGGF